ncbi:MAG TPA: hypothetical protein VK464_12365 [Symbiobacteriaceae bacterium]|jgi:uncharacterized membrane protein|nr:hypothetical protein [Symbiobacteriaceae bacterium]
MARFLTVYYPWISLVLFVILFIWVGSLSAQVAFLRARGPGSPRNRQELEEQYKAGTIGRDQYERLKAQL